MSEAAEKDPAPTSASEETVTVIPQPLTHPAVLLLLSFNHQSGDFTELPKDILYVIAQILGQCDELSLLWEYAQVYSVSTYAYFEMDLLAYTWWKNMLEVELPQKKPKKEDPDTHHFYITVPGLYGGLCFTLSLLPCDSYITFAQTSVTCQPWGPVGRITVDGMVGGECATQDLNVSKAELKSKLESQNLQLFSTWKW